MQTLNQRVRDLIQLAPEEGHGDCSDAIEAKARYQELLEFAWLQVRCRHALRHLEIEQERVNVAFKTLSDVIDANWDELAGSAVSILLRERGSFTESASLLRAQWTALYHVAYARRSADIGPDTIKAALNAVTEWEHAQAEFMAELMRDHEQAALAKPAAPDGTLPPDEPDCEPGEQQPDEQQGEERQV